MAATATSQRMTRCWVGYTIDNAARQAADEGAPAAHCICFHQPAARDSCHNAQGPRPQGTAGAMSSQPDGRARPSAAPAVADTPPRLQREIYILVPSGHADAKRRCSRRRGQAKGGNGGCGAGDRENKEAGWLARCRQRFGMDGSGKRGEGSRAQWLGGRGTPAGARM